MLKQSLQTWQRLRRCVPEAAAGRRQPLPAVALLAGLLLAAGVQAEARENQLAGIRLGRPAEFVTEHFGNPTRTVAGAPAAPGGPGGGAGGMMAAGGAGGGPAMGGMMGGGPGAGPGGGMGGGMMGGGMGGGMMGGAAGGAASTPVLDQKYEGKIASMQPEDFVAKVAAPEATNPSLGGETSAALGPGAAGGMGGGMGGGMMGGGMMGGGAGPQTQGQQPGAGPAITWVFERSREGVTFIIGFTEEGRVSLVCIGDDKPYSTVRGGRRPPYAGAKTSKGIGLGATFKNVILAYGFPESTEILGDEVLCKYFDRHGVAFTFRQGLPDPGRMRVSSITIKSPEE